MVPISAMRCIAVALGGSGEEAAAAVTAWAEDAAILCRFVRDIWLHIECDSGNKFEKCERDDRRNGRERSILPLKKRL